ncbi:glycosyltransferase family 4 protein [Iamia sp. SCSIO 61187]|uniref:glycosyltransferase family 4 protein n=1 Tax=Iamia sp. SCSIO 61187 TaxID=2722752 RepID=UPI001C62D4A6|nr:glycosyltransferase family 1 protein [Iamia sp. SCSIO 61187]QYG92454.1 glycosyltransferase family 4 protein [Iamia sp. SCSIO 61187]
MSAAPSPPPRVALTLEQCWHRVPGGSATSILALAGALADRDDVDVVGVAARHPEPPPAPWEPPIPVHHLPLPRLALYETWHAVRRPRVERATGPVDLVHATAVAVPGSRAPLVVTVHDLAFLAEPDHATRHGLRFFRRGTELARRHARLVLVPSEATAEECRRAGFDPGRIRIVPWGVDATPAGAEDVTRVRAAYGLDRPYVLFVGTVEPRKNLPRLVEAMAALGRDDVELVLVGAEGWNEDLAALLDALPGRSRTLGFLPTGSLGPLYAGAAAVAYPSIREGFGLPVLEAMAQGAAVVTSSGTATEEVAGDAAVLVDPRSVDAIAAGLDRVLSDPEGARTLGARARDRAATYTWDRTADLTVAAYREALAR